MWDPADCVSSAIPASPHHDLEAGPGSVHWAHLWSPPVVRHAQWTLTPLTPLHSLGNIQTVTSVGEQGQLLYEGIDLQGILAMQCKAEKWALGTTNTHLLGDIQQCRNPPIGGMLWRTFKMPEILTSHCSRPGACLGSTPTLCPCLPAIHLLGQGLHCRGAAQGEVRDYLFSCLFLH